MSIWSFCFFVALALSQLKRLAPLDQTYTPSQATPALLAKATNMKVIGRAGVGIDNIDVAEATRKGVLVMNTPGGNTVSTAQLAISLLCSAAR